MSIANASVNGRTRNAVVRPIPMDEAWLDYAKPRSEIMEVSPEVAEFLLRERNPNNRKITPNRVEAYRAEMTAGRWKLNGEGLILDRDGNVKNGQHRLTACVLSGVPLVTWVVFGVDPDVFDTLDRGRPRDMGDDLSIRGEKYNKMLPSALYLVWLDERGRLESMMSRDQAMSSQVLQEVLDRHPGIRDHVAWVCARQVTKLMIPRVASFLRYRFSAIDPVAAARFFDDVRDGAGLGAGDPVLLLRNRLQADRASKARMKPVDVLALAIKAWNYRRAGRTIGILRLVDGEKFPTIL